MKKWIKSVHFKKYNNFNKNMQNIISKNDAITPPNPTDRYFLYLSAKIPIIACIPRNTTLKSNNTSPNWFSLSKL